jgi:hypothetical protein
VVPWSFAVSVTSGQMDKGTTTGNTWSVGIALGAINRWRHTQGGSPLEYKIMLLILHSNLV